MSTVSMNKTTDRRAFTLIELLVVIGIMAVLIAVAVPNLSGLTKGAGLNTAINELRATLSLARQWAITHNEMTYVVFPSVNVPEASGAPMGYNTFADEYKDRVRHALRAYSVYTESDGYIRDWNTLPEGLFFEPTGGDANIFENEEVSGKIQYPVYTGPSGSERDIIAIGFTPQGTGSFGTFSRIYLTEGNMIVDPETGEIIQEFEKTANYSKPIKISHFTGTATVMPDE